MRLKITSIFILSGILFHNCGINKQVNEMKAFTECDFRIKEVRNITLAGINVMNTKSVSAFSLVDIGKLTYKFSKSDFDLKFNLDLEVKNPNPVLAAMNQLDWILYIDDIQVAAGISDERVEIQPNNGVSVYTIDIQSDLKKVLSGKSFNTAVNFALNLAGVGGKPTRILVKVKPSFIFGKKTLRFPRYITVKEEFGSEN